VWEVLNTLLILLITDSQNGINYLQTDRQNIFTAVYHEVAQISRSVDADGIPHR
jgi:hypothetical protein